MYSRIKDLRSTASQGTSNIPFAWFLLLDTNRLSPLLSLLKRSVSWVNSVLRQFLTNGLSSPLFIIFSFLFSLFPSLFLLLMMEDLSFLSLSFPTIPLSFLFSFFSFKINNKLKRTKLIKERKTARRIPKRKEKNNEPTSRCHQNPSKKRNTAHGKDH